MKLTIEDLQHFINEAIQEKNSILLESPGFPVVGQEQTGEYTKDPEDYSAEIVKRSLHHMAAQAQQLHDLLVNEDELAPHVVSTINEAAVTLEKVFKDIMYDKNNPEGI